MCFSEVLKQKSRYEKGLEKLDSLTVHPVVDVFV